MEGRYWAHVERPGFTRSSRRFRAPTPPPDPDQISTPPSSPTQEVEDWEDCSSESSAWETPIETSVPGAMDEMYGASRVSRRYSGAVGTLDLDDFIQEFDSWCDLQQMRNPKSFTPFMAWKGLFQHLEGPPMDDYHEFRRMYALEIEAWRSHWSPGYVSTTSGMAHRTVASTSGEKVEESEATDDKAKGEVKVTSGPDPKVAPPPLFNPAARCATPR